MRLYVLDVYEASYEKNERFFRLQTFLEIIRSFEIIKQSS